MTASPPTRETEKLIWRQIKALLVEKFGTVEKAALALDCSTSGLRKASFGLCPGIFEKIQQVALNLNAGRATGHFLSDENS